MTGRRIPEPPPGPTPERLAAERELAIAAHAAGEAVQTATELGREIGQQPDGYDHDVLDHLADTLKGWAIKLAMGNDMELVNKWTGRNWREIKL